MRESSDSTWIGRVREEQLKAGLPSKSWEASRIWKKQVPTGGKASSLYHNSNFCRYRLTFTICLKILMAYGTLVKRNPFLPGQPCPVIALLKIETKNHKSLCWAHTITSLLADWWKHSAILHNGQLPTLCPWFRTSLHRHIWQCQSIYLYDSSINNCQELAQEFALTMIRQYP